MNGKSHPLGEVAREDVPEIAGGHAERNRGGQLEACVGVIDDLRQYPCPVYRVDGAEGIPGLEVEVSKRALHEPLAVVEAALDGDAMHVVVCDRGHLQLLQRADAPVRIHDEYVDGRPAADAGDGGAAGIAAGGAQDVQALPAPVQDVVEELPEQLQGDVLESQGGPVEEFQNRNVAGVFQMYDPGSAEGAVGCVNEVFQVGCGYVVDESGQHALCQFDEVQLGQAVEIPRNVRDSSRHQQASVGCQAGQHSVLKTQGVGCSSRTDIPHALSPCRRAPMLTASEGWGGPAAGLRKRNAPGERGSRRGVPDAR